MNPRVSTLQNILQDLKSKNLLRENVTETIENSFSGLSADIIGNHFNNQDRSERGNRHNTEVKKFALTLHFYSPRAYDYVRSIFSLPHPRSLRHWTSSVHCEPVFFEDVFLHLQNIVSEDPLNADCSLVFDGMSIKQGIVFNKSKGAYEGFVNLGEDISCGEDDTVATEALIFMLCSLRSHWKYATGYVLINKINADTHSCLISRALQLALQHDLKVRCITCDGMSTNFAAMKLFGCRIGNQLEEINGAFHFENYKWVIYFTPDMPHMLKLGRNALSDMKVILDENDEKIEWKFLEQLHYEQVEQGLRFGNKLSTAHINYHRHK